MSRVQLTFSMAVTQFACDKLSYYRRKFILTSNYFIRVITEDSNQQPTMKRALSLSMILAPYYFMKRRLLLVVDMEV